MNLPARALRLAFLAACLATGVAGAQVLVAPGAIQRIQVPVREQTSTAPKVDPANDPELARATIARLRAKNRDLRQKFAVSLADLQALRGRLDEMTRTGGSLVTAHCVGGYLSQNTAGASEDCAASGYACASVSGLCFRECTTSTMCAPGFACNTGNRRCELPPPAEDD